MYTLCIKIVVVATLLISLAYAREPEPNAWIRINQLGYTPNGIKVAVWCGKGALRLSSFELVDSATGKTVFKRPVQKAFGEYGPFDQTYRLNFSDYRMPGTFYLVAGGAISPIFTIDAGVYQGTADFCLQYMRQQRSGFNPYLKDSCHTEDGYTMYGPMPDSTHIDVSGGWHDASDYLQYAATSANATWHLLAAYRDFKGVFSDLKQANGLDGKNGVRDVLDEARWGLEWLIKMNPRPDWMFNQLADDRDHRSLRLPALDSFYGKGFERPVYFNTGKPQGLFKYQNRTTGTASTAGKFASAFALAQYIVHTDSAFSTTDRHKNYFSRAIDAYQFGLQQPGVSQTAPGRAPYFYEEDNWVDDMELAAANIHNMINHTSDTGRDSRFSAMSFAYSQQEKITPWLGADTARHYQWYPFVNPGHFELAKALQQGNEADKANATILVSDYRNGIEKVWNKAKQNAFFRGIPFIWCSNNLTTAFAIQCFWYQQLSGDTNYDELYQANVDWLFGCNPWGTSMVYGLPARGDTPVDPHSAFTHLGNYPINGGLVDGPVYTSIYKNLIGVQLQEADEYEPFQSDLAVYHDDYGDYSTNEPTMDGTASLVYLLAAKEAAAQASMPGTHKGAINRGGKTKKEIALVFTGHEYGEGLVQITNTLQKHKVKGSFFFTGDFYRNPSFKKPIGRLQQQGHLLGPHSDKHLLYCDWKNPDSLLVTRADFSADLCNNLAAMKKLGIDVASLRYFLPPYEWYNDSIAAWTKDHQLQLINFTPGTLSTADYTTPDLPNYRSSDVIFNSILAHEAAAPAGLNGYLLLLHAGSGPKRRDKFYHKLDQLITVLKKRQYQIKTLEQMLPTTIIRTSPYRPAGDGKSSVVCY